MAEIQSPAVVGGRTRTSRQIHHINCGLLHKTSAARTCRIGLNKGVEPSCKFRHAAREVRSCGSSVGFVDCVGLRGADRRRRRRGPVDFKLMDCITRTTAGFTATPPTVALGASATLNWSIRVPGDCQTLLQNPSLNNTAVQMTGSQSVQPMSDTLYLLEDGLRPVRGQHWQADPLGPASVGGTHQGQYFGLEGLLIQALRTPHTTVYLASNVDMDLTGEIEILEGVSVIGGEPCGLISTQSAALLQSRTLDLL